MADLEDWRLYRGTTLGAATLVKARLYPKGCTWDAPATTPTFVKGGRTRIGARGPWHTERRGWRWDETRTGEDPRRIAAGRDSTGRGPTSHQLWHGRDSDGIPMPANPGTSRRWPATAGLADPGRLMTPTPTSGRNIWERPGMSRHRGPSPVSREQRLMAAGWTAPGRRARRRVGAATRIYQGLREDAGWPGRARCGHPAAELRKSKTWCQVAERSAVIKLNGLGRWASGQRGRRDEEANDPADAALQIDSDCRSGRGRAYKGISKAARESCEHCEVQLLRVRTCNPCRLSKFSDKFYALLCVSSTAPVPHPCITHFVPLCDPSFLF